MSLVTAILIGLLMGAVFGFALEKSRVFEPGVIVGQMQLRNFIMLKVFLTAVATGAVVLAVLNGFGFVKLSPKATLYGADIVGGLILGMGIALAGACPGTVMAQIGAGYRDAIVTLIGGIAGAVAYSYSEPALSKTFLGVSSGKLVLNTMLGIPYWAGALGLAAICIAILMVLERMFPSGRELGADVDGDLPPQERHEPPVRAVPAR
jgi:uncharacterized membrane protein YedE/YeeE